MRRPVWRWLRWLGAIVIAAFAIRSLVLGWADIRAQPVEWTIRPLWLVASIVLVLTMYAALIEAWRRMLAGWDRSLPFASATRIWIISSIGKYVPGKVWAIAGMALMAQRAGVAAWAATASAVVLQALAIGTGAIVAATAGTAALAAAAPWVPLALAALIIAAALGIALLLWSPFLRRLLGWARIEVPRDRSPGWQPVLFGGIVNIVAWCGYGVALWLLGHGLLDVPELTLPRAVGAFAASYVAGLVFLPAPGGIGVREFVFILMLEPFIGPSNALALAVASRVHLTITELGAAAPFLLAPGHRLRDR